MQLSDLKYFLFSNKKGPKHTSTVNAIDEKEEVERQQSALAELKAWRRLKSGAVQSLDTQNYILSRNPYSTTQIGQFEDALRAGAITVRALERKADFVFAKGIRTVLDLTEDDYSDSPDSQKERDTALKAILGNETYKTAKAMIDRVNRRTNFRWFLRAGYINAKGYGRSAILKDTNNTADGLPQSLNALSSRLLGNVYLDPNTKKIAYIEYNTDQVSKLNVKTFYEPTDLIYFTNRDYNISSNTQGYGLSEVEPVKDISETSRFYDEVALKEIAMQMFAGYLMLKFPNLHNQTEIQNIITNLEPGRPMAISTEVVAQMMEITHDMADIIEGRNQNDRRELRTYGMPSFTLGFEEITNRATAQYVLTAWKETFVEQERIWLRDIVCRDWFDPMWAKLLNVDIEQIYDIEAKIKLEFIEYSFDTLAQKIDAYGKLYDLGVISNVDLLEKIGEHELAAKATEMKKIMINTQNSLGSNFGKSKQISMDPTDDNLGSSQETDTSTAL